MDTGELRKGVTKNNVYELRTGLTNESKGYVGTNENKGELMIGGLIQKYEITLIMR